MATDESDTEEDVLPHDHPNNPCRLLGKGHLWGGVWETNSQGKEIKVKEHCLYCLCLRPKEQWRKKAVG